MQIQKKDIFIVIILTFFLSFLFYLWWIIKVLEQVLNIIVYIILFFWIYFLIKKIFKSKNIISVQDFSRIFLFYYSIIILIFTSFIASFSYYYNEKSPAFLKEYTLTNWEKTLVFQEMMHIWWNNFYENISKNLKKYKDQDFVHFFEWVRPGSEENKKEFDKAIWFEFDETLYPNISKLLKIEFQDYKKIIWELSEKDINIDLSIDEIMEEYKKLENISEKNSEIKDISKEIQNLINSLNQREIDLIAYIWQASLNFMLSSEENMKNMMEAGETQKIMSVILDKRDKNLAENILKSEHKKIYVTYGALHFPWVLKYLQEKDKNWKIEKIENFKAL